MNNSQLIHLYPDHNDISYLTIETNNYNNIKDLETRSISNSETLTTKQYRIKLEKSSFNDSQLRIKQICPQLIPEYQNEEFLTNVSLNGTKIKTILSKLEENNNLENKIIDEKDFNNGYIYSLASSPHIYAENAVLLDNEILLKELRDNTSFEYKSVIKGLNPNFESKSEWKNVLFGSHPRNIIYADYSKLNSLDMRLKTVNVGEIFSINSDTNKSFLNINELIERNCIMNTNFNAHIICCTNTLLIMDERFTNRPLLTWKHHLNLRPVHLNAFSLKDTNNSVLFCSDMNEIYAYQFNLNENSMPISFNFPLKVDTLDRDFETYLPKNYDKRYKRHFSSRFKQPILSISTVQDDDKFALFQVCGLSCFYIDIKNPFRATALVENRNKNKSEQCEAFVTLFFEIMFI
jgi:hypothetical protein